MSLVAGPRAATTTMKIVPMAMRMSSGETRASGLGLVVKRCQVVPHSAPPRVRITSDNPKYDGYERTLTEAYIQGRVIGQWRWL